MFLRRFSLSLSLSLSLTLYVSALQVLFYITLLPSSLSSCFGVVSCDLCLWLSAGAVIECFPFQRLCLTRWIIPCQSRRKVMLGQGRSWTTPGPWFNSVFVLLPVAGVYLGVGNCDLSVCTPSGILRDLFILTGLSASRHVVSNVGMVN